MMAEQYLLVKRGLYWRPNGAGYTGIKDEAGRYSRTEAEKTAHSCGEPVTMIAEADASPYSPSCLWEVCLRHRAEAAETARDEALAEVAALREALEAIAQYDLAERTKTMTFNVCCLLMVRMGATARAALPTPPSAALADLRARVRDAALEEVAEAFCIPDGPLYLADDEDKPAAIRAMKRG